DAVAGAPLGAAALGAVALGAAVLGSVILGAAALGAAILGTAVFGMAILGTPLGAIALTARRGGSGWSAARASPARPRPSMATARPSSTATAAERFRPDFDGRQGCMAGTPPARPHTAGLRRLCVFNPRRHPGYDPVMSVLVEMPSIAKPDVADLM